MAASKSRPNSWSFRGSGKKPVEHRGARESRGRLPANSHLKFPAPAYQASTNVRGRASHRAAWNRLQRGVQQRRRATKHLTNGLDMQAAASHWRIALNQPDDIPLCTATDCSARSKAAAPCSTRQRQSDRMPSEASMVWTRL